MGDELPAGYELLRADEAEAVIRPALRSDISAALRGGTVHAHVSSLPGAIPFRGRRTAWAAKLPECGENVLVRRSAHGGVFAPLTGELFSGVSRARHELRMSRTLADRGVATPEVLGYVCYRAGPLFVRIDVLVRFVPHAADLFSTLMEHEDGAARAAAIDGAGRLLRAMAAAGAEHPDINLRNVLVQRGRADAWVLDVDRVILHDDSSRRVARKNLARFERSALKLRGTEGLRISDDELASIALTSGAQAGEC